MAVQRRGARRDRRPRAVADPVRHEVGAHPLLRLQGSLGNRVVAQLAIAQRDDGDATGDDAPARPASSTIDGAYGPVDYSHSADDFLAGTDRKIRRTFERNGWVNTCAARLTHALNEAGHGIPSGGYYDSQGRRWMASARATRRILRTMWGAPDSTPATEEALDAVIDGLAAGQVAVFAGQGHVGVLKDGYDDPYVRGYLPVDVWIMAP